VTRSGPIGYRLSSVTRLTGRLDLASDRCKDEFAKSLWALGFAGTRHFWAGLLVRPLAMWCETPCGWRSP